MVWIDCEGSDIAGPSVIAEGIVASTPIATPKGWRAAGSLRQGAQVLTFDGGPQEVAFAHLHPINAMFPAYWPLLVPPWALDNREDLLLLPEQKVLIECDVAEELYGDPFALIPAQALAGWRGIDRSRPQDGALAVTLGFSAPQVIYASRGVLLSCPGASLFDLDWPVADHAAYTLTQARHLVACMMAEEAGAALRGLGLGQRQMGMGAG